MARPRRITFADPEDGAYHIISRALQREYRFKEAEKEKFLSLLRWLSTVYFVRVATFALMSNHIHLVIKMIRASDISEDELRERFERYYNRYANEQTRRELLPNQIPAYYRRFASVSRFMQDLKQRFSRWYNETHNGFGHVWAERFKSVLLVGTPALRACMLYVDLNALRAGIVTEPERYRYCGLHYFNKGAGHSDWLDHELLNEILEHYDEMLEGIKKSGKGLDLCARYLALVYEEGLNLKAGKASIPEEVWSNRMEQLPEEIRASIFMSHIPHFTNGIVLGSKEDCENQFEAHRQHFRTQRNRSATPLLKPDKGGGSPHKDKGLLSRIFSIRSQSL